MSATKGADLQRRLCLSGAAAALLTAMSPAHAVSSARSLRLAVVPQLTPVELMRSWTPLVEGLGLSGFPCDVVVYPTIAAFETEFLQGKADIVYLNPYHMVMAQRAHGYVPLLHDARPLEGVLVVRRDSLITKPEDIKHQRVAFPAPNAFAASLYLRAVMDRNYHTPFETHYAGNHRNAIRQVLAGDAMAAGAVKTTLEKEPSDVQSSLRIVYTTPPLTPHAIAVHPRVSTALRNGLLERMLEMASNADTKHLMDAIQMPHPVAANYKRDYAALEHLNIEKYVVTE